MGVASGCSYCWGHGCFFRSELRGGCLCEVYDVLVLCCNQSGTFALVAPEGWLLFGGIVKRGFTVFVI